MVQLITLSAPRKEGITMEGISMEGIISIFQAKVSGEDDYAGRLLRIYLRDISGV